MFSGSGRHIPELRSFSRISSFTPAKERIESGRSQRAAIFRGTEGDHEGQCPAEEASAAFSFEASDTAERDANLMDVPGASHRMSQAAIRADFRGR